MNQQGTYNTAIGGINWDYLQSSEPRYQDMISVGGHMTLGAFSMVLLYDHYHQKRGLKRHITLNLFALNGSATSHQLTTLMSRKQLDRINFKKFSTTHTKQPWKMTTRTLVNAVNSH